MRADPIVNVALPSIQDDLGFSQSDLAWVVNAYLIPFGGLLLLAGRFGDLAGRRRLVSAGLVVFIAASLLCGLATSQGLLISARFLQGIGGAMTSAVIPGMIVTMFPEPKEQAKAIGVYSFVAAAGGSLGLLLGGVLTDILSWHWIFFVNVPIGVATAIMAARTLRHEGGLGLHHGADVPSAVLVTAAISLAVYTVVQAAESGWGSSTTLILGGVAIVLLGGFIFREATAKNPLMPLSIFRNRNVTGANLIAVLMVGGMFGMFFMGALYLQSVLGFGAIAVGFAFLPLSGATDDDAGLASGLVNTSTQMGGALGLALLVTFSTTRTNDLLASGDSQATALTGGYQLAFGIAAGLIVAAIVLTLTVLERRQPQTQVVDTHDAREQTSRDREGRPAYEGV